MPAVGSSSSSISGSSASVVAISSARFRPYGSSTAVDLHDVGQADVVDQRQRALVELVEHAARAPEVERAAALALQRDAHVLQHREMRKHRRDLERAHHAEPRHLGRRLRGDVGALVGDAAPRRLQELGQQVEAGGLAGAVRPDQRVDGAALDPQVDAVDGDEAGEFLGQILGFEDVLTHTRRPLNPPPFRGASSRPSRPPKVSCDRATDGHSPKIEPARMANHPGGPVRPTRGEGGGRARRSQLSKSQVLVDPADLHGADVEAVGVVLALPAAAAIAVHVVGAAVSRAVGDRGTDDGAADECPRRCPSRGRPGLNWSEWRGRRQASQRRARRQSWT